MVKGNFFSVIGPATMVDEVLGDWHLDVDSFLDEYPDDTPIQYMVTIKSLDSGLSAQGVFLGGDQIEEALDAILKELPKDKKSLQNEYPEHEVHQLELSLVEYVASDHTGKKMTSDSLRIGLIEMLKVPGDLDWDSILAATHKARNAAILEGRNMAPNS